MKTVLMILASALVAVNGLCPCVLLVSGKGRGEFCPCVVDTAASIGTPTPTRLDLVEPRRNSCSGHGSCGANDACTCDPNFSAVDCSEVRAPRAADERGERRVTRPVPARA